MKKILTLIVLLLFTIATDSYSQTELLISDMELINLGDGRLFGRKNDDEKTPLEGKNKIITGFTTEYINAEFKEGYAVGKWEYFKNNKLEASQEFVGGFMEGKNFIYASDGVTLKSESTYSKGELEGNKITYYSDGKTLESVTPFTKGEVVGVIEKYYMNGKKESEKGMKNGVEDGPDRKYDENGNLTAETIYKNGRPDGKSFANMYSSKSGDYMRTTNYKDGQLDGDYSEVYANGTVKVKGKYKGGKKIDIWEANDSDGKKLPTEVYKDGDLVKKVTYYTNDNVDTEKEYQNGKEHGVVRHYTPDGTLMYEKHYQEGRQVGNQMMLYKSTLGDYYEYAIFDASGRKDGPYSEVYVKNKQSKVIGLYLKGQKHGKWTYYTNGKATKEEKFDNGKLVDSKTL